MSKTGVLLLNLGTPASPRLWDVFRYLNEFLTDGRVIDLPWIWRQWLVRTTIVPRRVRASASLYRRIWTDRGSPLMVHSEAVRDKLQQALGSHYVVTLGMRYQQPAIAKALKLLQCPEISRLVIIPLFPQYASATTGSVHQKVMEYLQHWPVIPALHFIDSYPTHPKLIQAFALQGRRFGLENYAHYLFSFHGLPEKQLRGPGNPQCYRTQCYATAEALAAELALSPDRYSVSFQSRLGKEPWTQPYTEDVICDLANRGVKRLLVFAPAFTCDCLETIDEIGREYAHQFQEAGGEELQLVPSVNDHPLWIEGLKELVTQVADRKCH